jgi:arylsulfatase A-like enzyme/Flp pilus assembly protein TadD
MTFSSFDRTTARAPWLKLALPTLLLAPLLAGCGGSQPAADAGASGEAGEGATTAREAPSSARSIGSGSVEEVQDVLLITIDTLRADSLHYAGREDVATPTIDRLAEQGVVFSNAHAHSVVTLPSHTNILTGLLPYQHGVRENAGFSLPASTETAASHFARAGFATGAVVGAFPLAPRYGLAHHFEFYDDNFTRGWSESDLLPERTGDEVVNVAQEWWRNNADRRRFLWIHLYDPHAPYTPPEPYATQYAESPYLGEVAVTDAYLRPLLEPFLEGQERPAMVIFTSDHGEALGAHGELTHGFFAYEETLKVPLVVWTPGLEGTVDDRLVRHIDLLPTMLEATGVAGGEELEGRSLFSDFDHDSTVSYLEALSANLNRGWAPLRGVIRGDDKFISVPVAELYDLREDSGELVNLVQEDRRTAVELRNLLPEEEVWPPTRQQDIGDSVQKLLLSLGYLTGDVGHRTDFTADDDPKNLVDLDRKLHEAIDDINTGRLDEALRKAREVIALRPMAVAYTLAGQVLRLQNRDREAVEVLEQAVATGYAQAATVRQLALSLSRIGRLEEALELMLPFQDSNDASNLNALASVLAELGRFPEARSLLERSLSIEANNPITNETLALVALREGRWEETRRYANAALAIDDEMSLAWNYLGGALYSLGQKSQAVDAWGKSVDNDPQNYDALFNLAVVAREINDRDRARRALKLFIDTAPPDRYGSDIQKAIRWHAQLGG